MNKFMIVAGVALITGCLATDLLATNTGHLVVTLTDKETGAPITNAVVVVKVDKSRSLSWHASPRYERTRSFTNAGGVADVEFTFDSNSFSWYVKTPSHYSQRFFIPGYERFGLTAEQSDYLDINTNTVEGLAKYNELTNLYNSGDYVGYLSKFEPKSVTYTNNVIYRSASFYPKRNPQPMYAYGENYDLYLSMKTSAIVTNGMEVMRYAPVDFDMKECLPVSYDPNHDDSWDGPAGKVADFRIERFKVVTNGVTTTYGWIEFAPGCGAYKRSTTGDDSFPTTYEADTNEVFVSRIPFECSSVSGKVVRIERILERGEYMVLRTRAATNDVGAVTSCNYSKILGPMFVSDHWFPRDRVSFKSVIFNPEPNDPNLESDLRSNLATRGNGSWYP